MNVVLVGSGNVATALGRLIKNSGHVIIEVYSRQEANARLLADELGCGFTDKSYHINKEADLYLFALPDSALHNLDKSFHFGNKLTVHTAGSVSRDILRNVSLNYGVLYPLQTLRKEINDIPDIPLLIEASSEDNFRNIENFAKTISQSVHQSTEDQRLKLHVAAVAVNNFTNHLYALASDFCKEERVDFNLLVPLINETAHRLYQHSPNEVQTGPAARNDTVTLDKHLKLLSAHPKLKYIYMKMTESIMGY